MDPLAEVETLALIEPPTLVVPLAAVETLTLPLAESTAAPLDAPLENVASFTGS